MRAKQPKRVIILTAVQTVTDDTMHVSSYEALMRYSSILSKQALSALSAAPVMISFEVSPWTANDRDDETDERASAYSAERPPGLPRSTCEESDEAESGAGGQK